MISDAAHSAADSLATGITLISLKIASRPQDDTHPYGHGKAESIASGLIGLSLFGAAFWICSNAILHIFRGFSSPVETLFSKAPTLLALIAAVVSVIAKEAMFHYTIRAARELNSPAMTANAWDHRSDALTSLAAAIGISIAQLAHYFNARWMGHMDQVAAAVVALFILKLAVDILREATAGLMDAAVPSSMIREISSIASEVEDVKAVTAVRARHVGAKVLADLKIEVDSTVSVAQGHTAAVNVKWELCRRFPQLTEVLIHVNPNDSSQLEHAQREKQIETLIDAHSALHMGFHDLSVRDHKDMHIVDFHLLLPPDLSVEQAHLIADDLEQHIRSQFDGKSEVNIHVEPWTK